MAGSETSKNLPLAAGSCYERKDCGGIEQARVSQPAALGLQKERKIAMTSTVLTVRNTLGSVRLRSDGRACGSVGAVMEEGKQSGLMASVHEGNSSERHGIRIRKNQKCKKRLLPGLHTWGVLPVIMFASLPVIL